MTSTNQNPCQKGGVCSINLGISPFYQCTCQYGFAGQNCQNLVSTTTVVAVPLSCDDLNPTLCQFYAINNYCSNSYVTNGIPIPTYCAKSCKTCITNWQGATGRPCVDSQPSCEFWASSGKCNQLPNKNICSKSCGLC